MILFLYIFLLYCTFDMFLSVQRNKPNISSAGKGEGMEVECSTGGKTLSSGNTDSTESNRTGLEFRRDLLLFYCPEMCVLLWFIFLTGAAASEVQYVWVMHSVLAAARHRRSVFCLQICIAGKWDLNMKYEWPIILMSAQPNVRIRLIHNPITTCWKLTDECSGSY